MDDTILATSLPEAPFGDPGGKDNIHDQAAQIKDWCHNNIPSVINWKGYQGTCACPLPSHGGIDENPSFSVNAEKGVWTCHQEKRSGHITELARELKVDPPACFKNSKKIEAIYPYRSSEGELIFEMLRYEGKKFSVRRPDGQGGYIYDKKGVETIPYRLDEVVQAIREGRTIFITEGEKDADNLRELGLQATTAPFGARKWEDSFNQYFPKDTKVVILPDNDDIGLEHGERIANSLSRNSCEVKLVKLEGLEEGGDVSDWLQMEHTIEELLKIIDGTVLWIPETDLLPVKRKYSLKELATPLSEECSNVEMIAGLFPRKNVTAIISDPKAGKTMLMLRLIRDLTRGTEVLDGLFHVPKPMKILVFETDMVPDAINQRMKQTNWLSEHDSSLVDMIYAMNLHNKDILFDLETSQGQDFFKQMLEEARPDVAFIDTLTQLHGVNENNNKEMRPVIGFLRRMAEEFNCALVINHHTRKRKKSEENASLSQHDSVGASVISRIVGNIIGLSKVKKDDKIYTVVNHIDSWYKPFSSFAFHISEVPDLLGGESGMHMDIIRDTSILESKYNQLKEVIQEEFGDGRSFTRKDVFEKVKDFISDVTLRAYLPKLATERFLTAEGHTRDRTYRLPLDEEPLTEGDQEQDEDTGSVELIPEEDISNEEIECIAYDLL